MKKMAEAKTATPDEKIPSLAAVSPVSTETVNSTNTSCDQVVTVLFAEDDDLSTESNDVAKSSIKWNTRDNGPPIVLVEHGFDGENFVGVSNRECNGESGEEKDFAISSDADSVLSLGLSVDSGVSSSMATIQTIKSANGRAATNATVVIGKKTFGNDTHKAPEEGGFHRASTARHKQQQQEVEDGFLDYASGAQYRRESEEVEDGLPFHNGCPGAFAATPKQLAEVFALFDRKRTNNCSGQNWISPPYRSRSVEDKFQPMSFFGVEDKFQPMSFFGETGGCKVKNEDMELDDNDLLLDVSSSAEESEIGSHTLVEESWKPRAESLQRECSTLKQIISVDSGNILKLKGALERLRCSNSSYVVEIRNLKKDLENTRHQVEILRREKEILLENEVEQLETIKILKVELDNLTKSGLSCFVDPVSGLLQSSTTNTSIKRNQNNGESIFAEQTRLENKLFASQIVDCEAEIDSLKAVVEHMTGENEQYKHEIITLQQLKAVDSLVKTTQTTRTVTTATTEGARADSFHLCTSGQLLVPPNEPVTRKKENEATEEGSDEKELLTSTAPRALLDNGGGVRADHSLVIKENGFCEQQLPFTANEAKVFSFYTPPEHSNDRNSFERVATTTSKKDDTKLASSFRLDEDDLQIRQTVETKNDLLTNGNPQLLACGEKEEGCKAEDMVALPLPMLAMDVWLSGGGGTKTDAHQPERCHDLEKLADTPVIRQELDETEKEMQQVRRQSSLPEDEKEDDDEFKDERSKFTASTGGETASNDYRKENDKATFKQQAIQIPEIDCTELEIEVQLENQEESQGAKLNLGERPISREADFDKSLVKVASTDSSENGKGTLEDDLNDKENQSPADNQSTIGTKKKSAAGRKSLEGKEKKCQPWSLLSDYCLFTD